MALKPFRSSPVNRDAADAMTTYTDEGDLLLRVAGMLPAPEFDPFLMRVVRRLGLRGWVRHDGAGVEIRAVGFEEDLARLVRTIRVDAPPAVNVRGMTTDLITESTPAVGEQFVVLAEDHEWHAPDGGHRPVLAKVA